MGNPSKWQIVLLHGCSYEYNMSSRRTEPFFWGANFCGREVSKNVEKCHKRVNFQPDAKIDLILCDLSSLQSVQAAAKEFKEKHWPLHALILNAGVFSPAQKTTIDGLETTFGINHVGHFYLIRELLPILRITEQARVVIVSSGSHAHSGVRPPLMTSSILSFFS